ncbi:MAG: hypothetical protein LiPW30_81 [Parcubacteria group bacterium LiPW_30]|nr:MAG: hypothetical protein LiPW30_81 [Parcubacteria group bacterium LiPW_30]
MIIFFKLFNFFYNSPSPAETFVRKFQHLRTVIVTADIHEGLYQPAPSTLFSISKKQSARHHRYLTFSHWSGVTPYTYFCKFAGSCVFVKQLPEKLSLRPLLLEASLIPKLRLLFCRVPWGALTRSPWSSRPNYLCRITVRFPFCYA